MVLESLQSRQGVFLKRLTMDNICKNCQKWKRFDNILASDDEDKWEVRPPGFGTCKLSVYWRYYNTDFQIEKALVIQPAKPSFGGDNVFCNENFGCIHFSPSPIDKKG